MQIKIQYLGQNGFLMCNENLQICIDLYLSNKVYETTGTGKRNYEAPCNADELKNVDFYFISHDHMDHMDMPTIVKLAEASSKTKFICPEPHADMLKNNGIASERIIGARAFEKIKLSDLYVTPIPVKHEDYVIINGEYGCLGYVFEWNCFTVFHAGDALADIKLVERLKQIAERYDIMFLPINGHDWKRYNRNIMGNMTYREALDLAADAGAELVVPMHYDLFHDNTENPAFFVDYLFRRYPTQSFKMFTPGEIIIIEK